MTTKALCTILLILASANANAASKCPPITGLPTVAKSLALEKCILAEMDKAEAQKKADKFKEPTKKKFDNPPTVSSGGSSGGVRGSSGGSQR